MSLSYVLGRKTVSLQFMAVLFLVPLQILEPSKMLHQWRRPRLSEFWFSAGSRSFSPTALAARGGDTVMWKVQSYHVMIYRYTYHPIYVCFWRFLGPAFFRNDFLAACLVWCRSLNLCRGFSRGGQVTCVWNCEAWKFSKSWKHFLKDDKSFVGRVKEVWIFHVHDIRTAFGFQVQVVLSNFRKGSLYHGRIQNFPKPFASHRIRQVASEALST